LTELVAREPNSDLFLIVQDDVVFSKGVFDYLAATAFPENCGVLSLFFPKCNNSAFGWHPFPTGFGMASAQALAFPREMAFRFLADPWTVNYRRNAPKSQHFRSDGLHHIEGVVGEWCRQNNLAAFTHSPSLSQHIGRDSIRYPGFRGKRDRRFADSFPGVLLDANQIYPKFATALTAWTSAGETVRVVFVWASMGYDQ